jgi:hypothetical protein
LNALLIPIRALPILAEGDLHRTTIPKRVVIVVNSANHAAIKAAPKVHLK